MTLRPAVQQFAEAMEAKLRTHDANKGPDGWRGADIDDLLCLFDGEVDEMNSVLVEEDGEPDRRIAEELIDVANYAMMIWDNCTNKSPRRKNPCRQPT